MSYFSEVKIVDKVTGEAAQVNDFGQLKITQFDSSGIEAPIGTNIDPNHVLNVGAQWQTGNDGIDRGTNTPVEITLEHNMVHRGKHFSIADYALNQAISTTYDFAITTPAGLNRAHMLFGLSASEGATLQIYEDCTDLTGGTAETPVNNHRGSAVVSALTIVSNPATITLGTRIEGFLIGGARSSGVVNRDHELVLKPESTYLFRITSLANNNDIGWEVYWYEHETQNMV